MVIPRNQIEIPATIGEARDRLLTARGWERAAIIFAFTEGDPADRLTAVDLPHFGIALQADAAIHRYRGFWQYAIDSGEAAAVKPGDQVSEPRIPWVDHNDPGAN